MRQFTVSEKVVVCCSDPAVAVTVTVEVTGGGVEDDPPVECPPQPESRLRPATPTASSTNVCNRRRLPKPKQHSATARVEYGSSGLVSRWRVAVVAEVVTVSVVEVAAPDGVTVAGEKLHDAPLGNPEQLNETGELKPFWGVTETAVVPLCPPVTVSDVGEATMEKSGGRLMVYVALATTLGP